MHRDAEGVRVGTEQQEKGNERVQDLQSPSYGRNNEGQQESGVADGQMQRRMSQSMRDSIAWLSVDFLQSRGAEEGGGPNGS